MNPCIRLVPIAAALLGTFACAATEPSGPAGCNGFGTPGATARCLSPTLPPEHYVSEANKYFDTLDVSVPAGNPPAYSENVARWEWPPWLLLTGFGRSILLDTETILRERDPSTVPVRDCRFFSVQPFARCRVTFQYGGGTCPIYEEFVFNDAGEMTFIEAWSDLPGMRPTPDDDAWGERSDLTRLSLRVPGLGAADGLIDPYGAELEAAAATDPQIADFMARTRNFWGTWFEALRSAPDDFFARGCGW